MLAVRMRLWLPKPATPRVTVAPAQSAAFNSSRIAIYSGLPAHRSLSPMYTVTCVAVPTISIRHPLSLAARASFSARASYSARASAMPPNAAIRPSPTLPSKYRVAGNQRPACARVSVSTVNDEKVVYPPSSPTAMR